MVVVIGGGPAGLAVAHALSKKSIPSVILEQDRNVGGLSKTVNYRGFSFDIGGHRFFTKNKEVQDLWQGTLGKDFLLRPRMSRIFYRGKFFHYPLNIGNTLAGLGPYDSLRVLLSFCKARLSPIYPETSFQDWITNRFGHALFSMFFKTYTEKVWGIPCTRISPEWAAQRIRNLSLSKAVLSALRGGSNKKVASLINQFHYPRLGPGQMYEAMAGNVIQKGCLIHTRHKVVEIRHAKGKVRGVSTWGPAGRTSFPTSQCFCSLPITELINIMQPPAPESVREAARSLRYRSLITVNLLSTAPFRLSDNWIYLHAPEVRAGRLQLFQNWSPFMVPEEGGSSVTLEYFSFENDALWTMSDSSLIQLALEDLAGLGLDAADTVFDGLVIRYANAYPLYEKGYNKHLAVLRGWLAQFDNLYCIGRYGQFRYNNMDHSIITGLLACRRMLGEDVDPWSVNAEAEYLEHSSHPGGNPGLLPGRSWGER